MMRRGSTQAADSGAIIRDVLAAILRLPDDKLQDVYDYVRRMESTPAQTGSLTARELRHLPASERGRILREQAETAAPYYQDVQETAERVAWQAGDIVHDDTEQP